MEEKEHAFRKAVGNSINWLAKSRALRIAAMREFWSSVADGSTARKAGDDNWIEASVHTLQTARMLHGLAIETALKGLLVQQNPNAIEFKEIHDGTGSHTDTRITKIGVPIGQGHDLVDLADAAGLFGDDGLGDHNHDPLLLRKTLEAMKDAVVWGAKYPVPRLHSDMYVDLEGLPPRLLGLHYADTVEPLLDHLYEWHDKRLSQ